MAQTNILLEAGTNELEVVEFHLDELVPLAEGEEDEENTQTPGKKVYRGYYGVNVAKVLEIIRKPKVTELPEVQHPCVLGAFNLRSRIIPLVDLALWLGKEHDPAQVDPKTIVTEFNNVSTAFLVSGVNRIHRISWEQVEQPDQYVASVSSNCIVGVVRLEGRIVFLLDLERVVSTLNPKLGLHLGDMGSDWNSEMGYKILIADDSSLVRQMQRDLLEKAGFTVIVATNGKEAWDKLCEFKAKAEELHKSIGEYVQCVVTDIEMPMMDGLNLTSRIKEDPILKPLPVLIFSSLITEKLRHRGESVGADGQISKPEVGQLAMRAAELIKARGLDKTS